MKDAIFALTMLVIALPFLAYGQAAPPPEPYKVLLKTTIKQLDGSAATVCNKPIRTGELCPDADLVPMTISQICVMALNSSLPGDRNDTVEQTIARGMLAQQIYQAQTMQLTDAMVKLIETRLHEMQTPNGTPMFPAIILAQVANALHKDFKPEEIK